MSVAQTETVAHDHAQDAQDAQDAPQTPGHRLHDYLGFLERAAAERADLRLGDLPADPDLDELPCVSVSAFLSADLAIACERDLGLPVPLDLAAAVYRASVERLCEEIEDKALGLTLVALRAVLGEAPLPLAGAHPAYGAAR